MTHTRKRPKYYFRNALAHTHTQRDALRAKTTRATYCIYMMRFPQKFTTIIITTDVQSQSSLNSMRNIKKETRRLEERDCVCYILFITKAMELKLQLLNHTHIDSQSLFTV